MAEQEKEQFRFNISLSVLNHLGRGLYRNFITVLGEAISNSWDAEATKVEIVIDKDGKNFSIKDNGIGMDETDFQEKFLKIGYSKRNTGTSRSPELDRPYIGRKGIGKLALLSCAQRIHILSKKTTTHYIGGIIDNKELNKAIEDDSTPEEYGLLPPNRDKFRIVGKDHYEGTIIYFENINEGINNNIETLKKLIALYFRFSLIDPSFRIFVNEDEVTSSDLKDIAQKTDFLWTINEFNDPFFKTFISKDTGKNTLKEGGDLKITDKNIRGFIASVNKPQDLNILGIGEKIGVDVFVNGRLRETNILKHTPNYGARHITQYIYGQIHFDTLDSGDHKQPDRFTSSREGIKPEDKLYKDLLEKTRIYVLEKISPQWDIWRRKHKLTGDPEGTGIRKYQRWLEQSKNAREKYFNEKIDSLVNLDSRTKNILKNKLGKLSYNNMEVYQDLFMLENIFKEFLKEKGINDGADFPNDVESQKCLKKLLIIKRYRAIGENGHALQGNIVKTEHILNYLDLVWLGILTDTVNGSKTGRHAPLNMEAHAKEISPVRNAVMHTNEISQEVMEWYKIKNTIITCIDELNIKP